MTRSSYRPDASSDQRKFSPPIRTPLQAWDAALSAALRGKLETYLTTITADVAHDVFGRADPAAEAERLLRRMLPPRETQRVQDVLAPVFEQFEAEGGER